MEKKTKQTNKQTNERRNLVLKKCCRRPSTVDMASAQSLLGLVNQLQTMESSFCDVLMEAALKLASLTDANVFVMVETAEGRRFAGTSFISSSRRGKNVPGLTYMPIFRALK